MIIRHLKYLATLSCMLLLPFFGLSQIHQFEYSTLDINQECGLKSKECYYITKDSKENLWICTDLGVYKYDGFNTVHYSINDGLLSNVVFHVYEDYKGRIWFLTKSTQLCYLENGKIKNYKYNDQILKHCIYPTSDRKKLIVTPKNIYYSVDFCGYFTITPTGEILDNNNPQGRLTLGLFEDSLCTIGYKYSQKTIEQVKKDAVMYRPLYINQDGNIRITQSDSIERHKKFDLKHLVYSKNKLEGYALLGGALYNFPQQTLLYRNASCYYPDPLLKDAFWIGTSNGFFHATIRNGKFIITPNTLTLKGNYITSIYCDSQGNTWITSLESGVTFLPKQRIKKIDISPYFSGKENIRDFEMFQSEIYVSTKFHLLNLNSARTVSARYSLLKNYSDSILFVSNLISRPENWDEHEKLLKEISFTRDLLIQNKKLYSLSSYVSSIHIPSEKLNIHYQSHLGKYKDNHFIRLLAVDNKLYFSSSTKLFELRNDKVESLKELKGMEVSDMAYVPEIGILIATKSKGLFTYAQDSIHPLYFEDNTPIVQNISSFYYSQNTNCLFIGTYQGLLICHLPTKKRLKLNKNHGFINSKISKIKEFDNEIYVSSFDKLYKIGNDEIRKLFRTTEIENTTALASITNVKQDDISANSLVNLSYFSDFITLSFEIKDYRVWKNKKYQYRIDKKGNWNTLLSPEIIIPNPRKGFNLEIRYLKYNDEWSKVVIDHNINIRPPFYKTKWFYILLIITLFVILYLLLRYRLKRKVEKLQVENNLLSYQQRLQNARIKPHFIFNVLNSINGHILFNENKLASNYLIKFSQLMRNLLEKSGDDQISIQSEVELLEAYLSLEQIRKEGSFEYSINLPIALKSLYIPSLMVQPFVENAVIHGISDLEGKGKIEISFEQVSDQSIRIEICNSNTISSDKVDKWNASSDKNAIGITRERIKNLRLLLNNKALRMNLSNSNNKTCVEMVLPILKHPTDNEL